MASMRAARQRRAHARVGIGEPGRERQQDVVLDRREGIARTLVELARCMVEVERGAVIDQPEPVVPDEHVGVARRAVEVAHERVEPDDARRELGVGLPRERIERDRAGQVVEREVERRRAIAQLGAGADQVLDLGVGLGARQVGVDQGEDDLGNRQAGGARQLAGDELGDQCARPLAGAAELEHVEAIVVALDDRRQRAALAQRRDVAGRAHGPHVAPCAISACVRYAMNARYAASPKYTARISKRRRAGIA